MRHGLLFALSLLLCAYGCTFQADLSRFAPCDDQGFCPIGFSCWQSQQRCVPLCGSLADCPNDFEDAGDSFDAGPSDAGPLPLLFDSPSLPPAVEDTSYQFQLPASGGVEPRIFWIVDGGLPDGFSLSAQGLLTGVGSGEGNYSLVIRSEDHSVPPQSMEAVAHLFIRGLLRVASPVQLTDAIRNSAYSERLAAIGGAPPYSFEIASGAVPTGLTLHSNGQMDGIPSVINPFSFQLRVTDSDAPPQIVLKTLNLEVISAPLLTFTFLTRGANDGRMRDPYSRQFRTVGGTSHIAYTLSSGTLPPGVNLNAADGLLTGTPTQAGSYTFTLKATDSGFGSAQASFSATVFSR